jgi:hypothetical protein
MLYLYFLLFFSSLSGWTTYANASHRKTAFLSSRNSVSIYFFPTLCIFLSPKTIFTNFILTPLSLIWKLVIKLKVANNVEKQRMFLKEQEYDKVFKEKSCKLDIFCEGLSNKISNFCDCVVFRICRPCIVEKVQNCILFFLWQKYKQFFLILWV